MPTAHFLCRDRHGAYLFRRIIPIALRRYFQNRREIRKSLQTYQRAIAVRRARVLAAKMDQIFDDLEEIEDLEFLSEENQQRLNELALEILTMYQTQREPFEDQMMGLIEKGTGPNATKKGAALFDKTLAKMKRYSDKMLALEQEHKLLSLKQEALAGHIAARRKASGEALLHQEISLPALQASTSGAPLSPSISRKKLSVIWKEYSQEKINAGHWKSSSQESNEEAFRSFIDIVGDLVCGEVTMDVIRTYRQEVQDYPRYRFRRDYADMSLTEVRAQEPSRISSKTIEMRMAAISSFFKWAERLEYIAKNYLTGLVHKNSSDEERLPFSREDLLLIFSQPRFTHGKFAHDWEYWLPLLALYTGARLEELCQLRGNDLHGDQDCCWLNIHDDGANNLKTKQSRRLVPIHQHLIELGFREFASLRGEEYLFDVVPRNGKRGHYPSRRFGVFKTKLGIDGKKAFHSFRHNFADALVACRVDSPNVRALLGHKQQDVTFGRYVSTIPIEVLNGDVQRIDFSLATEKILQWSLVN
jgi:integrase